MKNEFISQYKSSLAMLGDTIEKCPESLWDNRSYKNPYWRIVYHTLYYTAFYLSKNEASFIAFTKHISNYHILGTVTHNGKSIAINTVYSQADLLDYTTTIIDSLGETVIFNDDAESGFEWLKMNRLEVHLYTIRHLQHHIGQLTERLRQNGVIGIEWVR